MGDRVKVIVMGPKYSGKSTGIDAFYKIKQLGKNVKHVPHVQPRLIRLLDIDIIDLPHMDVYDKEIFENVSYYLIVGSQPSDYDKYIKECKDTSKVKICKDGLDVRSELSSILYKLMSGKYIDKELYNGDPSKIHRSSQDSDKIMIEDSISSATAELNYRDISTSS